MKLNDMTIKLLEQFLIIYLISCIVVQYLSIINYSAILNMLTHSHLLYAIRNTPLLTSFQISGIVVSLPMLIDIMLDYNNPENLKGLVALERRFFYIMMGFTVPSITYLVFNRYEFYSYLYVLMINMQFLFFLLMCIQSIINLNLPNHKYIITATGLFISLTISQMLFIYGTINLLSSIFCSIASIIFLLSQLCFIGLFLIIMKEMIHEKYRLSNGKDSFDLNDKELQYFILNLTYVCLNIIIIIYAIFFYRMSTWFDLNAETLILYYWIGIAWVTITTILPGRVIRYRAKFVEESLRVKRIFVRHVSHEVRSPLNVACGGLDLLRIDVDELIDHEKLYNSTQTLSSLKKLNDLKVLLQDVSDATQTAIFTLNDLLNYERIDTGEFIPDLKTHELTSDFLKLVLRNLILLSHQKGVCVNISDEANVYGRKLKEVESCEVFVDIETVDIDPKTMYLYCDKYLIEQVARNLVTNAVKFTPESKTIKLISKLLSTNELDSTTYDMKRLNDTQLIREGTLLIEIIDEGEGITMNNQSKLFNEFVQFNPNELQGGGGSGLGLWISSNIIRMHGGSISCYSNGVGHGTMFSVKLPLYKKVDVCEDKLKTLINNDILKSLIPAILIDTIEVIINKEILKKTLSEERMIMSNKDLIKIEQPIIKSLLPAILIDTIEMIINKEVLKKTISNRDLSKVDSPIDILLEKSIEIEDNCDKIPFIRFLIADDSKPNRKIMTKMIISILTKRGYNQCDDEDILKYSHTINKISSESDEVFSSTDDNLMEATFHIDEADDGTKVLELINKQIHHHLLMYDYIFIDNIMITKHGPETVYEIRNTYHLHDVKIFGITGNGLIDDVEIFKKSGLDDIVIKPLPYKKLEMILTN